MLRQNSCGSLTTQTLSDTRDEKDGLLEKYGTAGTHAVQSDDLSFSCKKRGICPSCTAKRAHVFAENLHENVLLPYPHKHIVLTLPTRLRSYFRFDRKLNSILYKAAWRAWSDYVSSRIPDAKPAAVFALHSVGDTLNFHPHLHGTLLSGAVNQQGEFIPLENIDVSELEQRFANYIFTELLLKNRKKRMKAIIENNFQPLEESEHNKKPASGYWARWIRKVYEIDPLVCPKCGGNMNIKAIIHDPNEIARICQNLNI